MTRTGVELKPTWRTIPLAVRRAAEGQLGAPVQRAMRVWGGYTPTPTYRLRLADGRRAFFKAVGTDSNEFSRAAHQREERVYRELPELIFPWAPAFYGALRLDDWQVILLEDLGPKSAPPWSPALVRNVARGFGQFHAATLGASLPDWLPRREQQFWSRSRLWTWLVESGDVQAIAELAGDQADSALSWLKEAAPVLADVSRRLADVGEPAAFLHRDVRSDNLRWVGGRLRLFDWPHVGVGPPEYDAAAFSQTVTVEGGPPPEVVLAAYAEGAPIRPAALDSAVAALAGFFADQAWQDDPPGLPRLRRFQRHQLAVTLAWASRRLGLPYPDWVGRLA